jgi:cholesterol oxidase
VVVLSAAGVGGGSLVYANVLYRPPEAFDADPQWADIADWRAELAPYYDLAGRMLAEAGGATVLALTTVTAVSPRAGGGYTVRTVPTGRLRGAVTEYTADQVIVAAGALGTQRLLHRMRDTGVLPHLSSRLGLLSRTNSESIVGAKARRSDVDFSRGVAITSSFHPNAHTHVEPVRYGRGSNAMALLQTVLTDGDTGRPRWREWVREMRRTGRELPKVLSPGCWSEKTILLLVMQSLDNSVTLYGRRNRLGRYKLTSRQGHGEANPGWIPAANEAARRTAAKIDGHPGGTLGEIANVPMTAHFMGGATIGAGAEHGVVDAWHRAFGHPGLHVVDGAAVPANLGVNPSLTITAQAERAMAFWPNKGEPDPRPELGARYAPIAAVAPVRPLVPAEAPAALRLPIVAVNGGIRSRGRS